MVNIKSERTVKTSLGDITYTLYKKSIKNLNMRIHRDGSVMVSIPKNTSPAQADKFVIAKSESIISAIKNASSNIKSSISYTDGEKFMLLGKELVLKIIFDDDNYAEHDKSFIYLHTKSDAVNFRKTILDKWYQKQCIEIFPLILKSVHKNFLKYNVPYPYITIRQMTSRWGSCNPSKNRMTINLQLIKAPISCIEYVAVHEFTHYIHQNHSKDFYSFMENILPDWKARKAELEKFFYK